MPVKSSVMIKPVSEDDFHLLDQKVMEAVFSMHKELGRFCDEKIYQNELAYRCQALTYLLLMGMHHGKLINMRPQSVQHSFVSTRLTPEKRYMFTIDDQEWKDLDEDSIWLKQLVTNLLSEWGAFLDTNLFYDAINHFRGGEEHVVKRIEVVNDSRILGTQRAHLLNQEIAFKFSAVTKAVSFYEQHLRRFISHTSLKAIQWINFSHDKIVFITISQ